MIYKYRNYIIFVSTFTVILCIIKFVLEPLISVPNDEEEARLEYWLDEVKDVALSDNENAVENKATSRSSFDLPFFEQDELYRSANMYKERMIFKEWLRTLHLQHHFQKLLKEDVISIEDVYLVDDSKAHSLLDKDFAVWSTGRQMLPTNKEALENLKSNLWENFILFRKVWKIIERIWFWGCMLVVSLCTAGITTICICMPHSPFRMKTETSLLNIVTGRYLDPHMCETYFMWQDLQEVGSTVTFIVKFFQRNGLPYPICDRDNVVVRIKVGCRSVLSAVTLGGMESDDVNRAMIVFTVRQAGDYCITVTVKDDHIPGSPFLKTFYPGKINPQKTVFDRRSSIEICYKNVSNFLMIDPRDSYDNSCLGFRYKNNTSYLEIIERYHSVITKAGCIVTDVCFQSFTLEYTTSKICFDMTFLEEGCFFVEVYYEDILLTNGSFTCIVLNDNEKEMVMKLIKNRNVSFDSKLIRIEGEPPFKPKKVVVFISPKQFTIKEHMLKFIPRHVAAFRLCPCTKLRLLDETANGVPCFMVDDGRQPKLYLTSSIRTIIAAVYTQFLLNNIGGSETFQEKQTFFYYEVRQFHQKHNHESIKIKVIRNDIINSSLKGTKYFGVKEWCKNFQITFQDEEGVDWGGLRREWIQVISVALFDQKNGMFKSFTDSPQASIHPNKNRPDRIKLKHFEFVGHILGKCLYESALGGSYSQYIKARFTRSFLAHLIGLRVNYNYFKYDDPDLYLNKVKYILKNDVTEMDLYFVDEEYNDNGQLLKVVDLIPNGNKIKVDNKCKTQYLDSLAQYRLISSVKDELDSVLKGLTDIIPDNLLCIFDENELELMLCGTEEYDVSDFKAHHIEVYTYGSPSDFSRILNWFWIVVSNFSKEEMARLLQFTTGSSQLPPGGFRYLNPTFKITVTNDFSALPVAYTCFNQLYLSNYDSYEQLEKSLLLAINEGFEGFSLN